MSRASCGFFTPHFAEFLDYLYLTVAFCACSQNLCAATRALARYDGVHDGCDSHRIQFAGNVGCSNFVARSTFKLLSDLYNNYLVRNEYLQREEGNPREDKKHPKSEGDADDNLR